MSLFKSANIEPPASSNVGGLNFSYCLASSFIIFYLSSLNSYITLGISLYLVVFNFSSVDSSNNLSA